MATNTKLAKERKAASQIAEIMYDSLRKLPQEERQARVKAIQKIKISRRNISKHPSNRANLLESSPRVAVGRKRARP